jgi:tetratricopeptide (TPR) repeat protein
MSAMIRYAFCVALFATLPTAHAAAADNDGDMQTCLNGNGEPMRLACDRVITEGKLPQADMAVAHNDRGIGYGMRGDYQLAIDDFSRALELKPDYHDAIANRGMARRGLRQFDQAIADFDRAMALKPGFEVTYHQRGVTWFMMGQNERAIRDFDEAIRLKPDYLAALRNRASAHLGLAHWDPAIADLTEVVRLQPGDTRAHRERCMARAVPGKDLALALVDCNRAVTLGRDDRTLDARGFLHFRMSNFPAAREDLEASLALKPSPTARYTLGLAKIRMGDAEGGKADIAAAIAMDPSISRAYESMGIVP